VNISGTIVYSTEGDNGRKNGREERKRKA